LHNEVFSKISDLWPTLSSTLLDTFLEKLILQQLKIIEKVSLP